MKIKIKIQPKIAYYLSIVLTLILFFYFSYKGVIAYFIHKELYGGGIDILITLRATLAGVMLFLSLLLLQFSKWYFYWLDYNYYFVNHIISKFNLFYYFKWSLLNFFISNYIKFS